MTQSEIGQVAKRVDDLLSRALIALAVITFATCVRPHWQGVQGATHGMSVKSV